MAGNINGIGTSLGISNESEWGTAVVPATKLINFSSESMKLTVTRKEEDSLLASTASGAQDIMGRSVSGDFSVVAKPDELGYLFAWATGKESVAADAVYGGFKHVFTPCSATEVLPSATVCVDRKIAVKSYSGCKVDSLKLDAKSGDYLRATVSLKGKSEGVGSFGAGLEASTLKAFKFLNGTCKIDGADTGNITGVSLSYSNKLDDGDNTLGSGLYNTEPEHALREITITFDTFYDALSETIRETKYKEGALASAEFTFESPSELATGKKFKFTVVMPYIDITAADANVSGRDKIKVSIVGKALAIGSTAPITINYWDLEDEAYF